MKLGFWNFVTLFKNRPTNKKDNWGMLRRKIALHLLKFSSMNVIFIFANLYKKCNSKQEQISVCFLNMYHIVYANEYSLTLYQNISTFVLDCHSHRLIVKKERKTGLSRKAIIILFCRYFTLSH